MRSAGAGGKKARAEADRQHTKRKKKENKHEGTHKRDTKRSRERRRTNKMPKGWEKIGEVKGFREVGK